MKIRFFVIWTILVLIPLCTQATDKKAPKISLEPATWDLGTLQYGAITEKDFTIRNTGNANLVIKHIKSTCKCAVSHLEDHIILPGASTTFTVKFSSHGTSGMQYQRVRILSNDPTQSEGRINIHGTIEGSPVPKLDIASKTLDAGLCSKGESKTLTFAIRNIGQSDLHLLRAKGSKNVSIDFKRQNIKPGAKATFKVNFTSSAPGVNTGTVILDSNDRANARITIRVTSYVPGITEIPEPTKDSSGLALEKSWYDFGTVKEGETTHITIPVENTTNVPLTIFAPRHIPSFLRLESLPKEEIKPNGKGKIILSLDPNAQPGVMDDSIKLPSTASFTTKVRIFGFIQKEEISYTKLSLILTGNELGEIEPCGCVEGELGGLQRSVTLCKKAFQEDNTLVLSTGDHLGTDEPYQKLRADVFMDAMAIAGHDAACVGETELAFGVDFFNEKAGGLPFLCANVVDAKTTKHIGLPIIIKEQAGLKIGILGVMGKDHLDTDEAKRLGIDVLDPVQCIKDILAKNQDCDYVVLLVHAWRNKALKLVRKLPNIDLAIVCHSTGQAPPSPERIGKTLILEGGSEGRYASRVDLFFKPDKSLSHNEWEAIPLTNEIPEDQDVVKLIEAYKAKLKDLPLPDVHQTTPAFVSSETCAECHKEIYERQQKDKHASSITTLTKERYEYDPSCLACHTTGYEKTGGFRRIDLTPEAANVQCEACHGPGAAHVAKPEKPGYGKVDQYTCLICHTCDKSPKFDFKTYGAMIKH